MKMWNEAVGTCHIRKRPQTLQDVPVSELTYTNSTMLRLASLAQGRRGNYSSGLTDDSGCVIDPDDSRFRIRYQYLGVRLDSRGFFLTTLDGLSNAAREDKNRRCRTLTGADPDDTVMFTVSALQGDWETLTYQYSARVMLLVARLSLSTKRFEEMRLFLEYDGVKFGEGFVDNVAPSRHDSRMALAAA